MAADQLELPGEGLRGASYIPAEQRRKPGVAAGEGDNVRVAVRLRDVERLLANRSAIASPA